MLLATQSALDADGDLLDSGERQAIESLMADLRQVAETGTDPAVVEAAVQTLAKGTEAFAAQRMNEGIRKALSGRNVETL